MSHKATDRLRVLRRVVAAMEEHYEDLSETARKRLETLRAERDRLTRERSS